MDAPRDTRDSGTAHAPAAAGTLPADSPAAVDTAPADSPAAVGTELAPFCIHLQSKKSYFRTLPPREESDILDASRHCWCRKTMQALGPDGEVVAPEDCRRPRGCFQGLF